MTSTTPNTAPAPRALPAYPRPQKVTQARVLRSEWTKLRTQPSALWALLSAVVLVVAFGIGYSLAVVIPSLILFYLPAIAKLGIPYLYTPLVLMALGGLFQVLGALLGPETRDVDMTSAVAPGGREVASRATPA